MELDNARKYLKDALGNGADSALVKAVTQIIDYLEDIEDIHPVALAVDNLYKALQAKGDTFNGFDADLSTALVKYSKQSLGR